MVNETMRIFFPLKIFTYPKGEYELEDNPVEITPAEAVAYEDAILAAIAKENRFFKNDRGLAEYIHDEALNKKVYSLYPSVVVVDGELWGVMTAGLTEALSEKQPSFWIMWSDKTRTVMAKGLEQRPIRTRAAKSTSASGITKTIPSSLSRR